MPRNSSGTYTLPLPPVVPGTVIEAEWANDSLADIAQALTESLDRGGRGGMTGPFFMADGSAAAPGMAFANEPATGFYRAGSGQLGIATQGVSRAVFDVNGMNVAAVYVTGAITQPLQLATKAYVDGTVGGSSFLPLIGGEMTGGIDFRNVPGPLAFYDTAGTTLWGAIDVTSSFMHFTSGAQIMQFTSSGILSAPGIAANGDVTANNDVYAQRWIGVGTRGALMYSAIDATFGPYLGFRSGSSGAALTLYDDGVCASAGYRALNELICTGIVTAYNSGVKYRSGTVLNAGRFMDCRINPPDGALVWYNESGTPIFWINQNGTFGSAGSATINGTPVP